MERLYLAFCAVPARAFRLFTFVEEVVGFSREEVEFGMGGMGPGFSGLAIRVVSVGTIGVVGASCRCAASQGRMAFVSDVSPAKISVLRNLL